MPSNAMMRFAPCRAPATADLEPAAMEVVLGPDGTITFRVLGDKAAADTTQDSAGTKAWNAEIAKLKATPKGGKE